MTYLLMKSIFGRDDNNLDDSKVIPSTKEKILLHTTSNFQANNLSTANGRCGVSYKKYFLVEDKSFLLKKLLGRSIFSIKVRT